VPGKRDEGFTLLEVVVSLGIIAVMMASLTVFMINSRRVGHYAALRDAAVQLAVDGLEKAHGARGSALLSGRQQCTASCAAVASAQVDALLGTGTARWDATGPGTLTVPQPGAQPDGSTVSSPGDPEVVQLDGVAYRRYYHLGACWQPTATGAATSLACGAATATTPLARLVVAVVWSDSRCAGGACAYCEAALFSIATTDPFLVG